MPVKNLKALYKAKTLAELEGKANIQNIQAEFKNKAVQIKIKSSHTLYKKAMEFLKEGDEEFAYIYLMRYNSIFDTIRSASDRSEYMKELQEITLKILDELGKLKKSLTERYNENEKANNERKAHVFNSPSLNKNLSNNNTSSDDNSDIYEMIDSENLVSIICSASKIENILIIDIRPADEFQESSISAAKFSLQCYLHVMNIPNKYISSGLPFSALQKKLINSNPSKFPEFLERRNIMKIIVIVDSDDSSHVENYHSRPAVILADILHKWDISANKIKVKPKILKGGFNDFLIKYPTYVTNSMVMQKNYANDTVKPQVKLNGFCDYASLEKEKISPEINRNENSLNPILNGISVNKYGFIAKDGFMNIPPNIKIPGSAKPVIPDRSSKPISTNHISTLPQDVEMKSSNILKPIPGILTNKNLSLNNGNIEDDTDDELPAGDFDDIQTNKQSSTIIHHRKEYNDAEMSDIDQDDNHSPTRDVSTPISMQRKNGYSSSFGTSSNLSRSFSSPNVTQLDEMQSAYNSVGSSKVLTPFIDRSIKPNLQMQKRLDFQPKERNFSVQYTTKHGFPVGLKNLGNTCFMNAVLQCLNNTADLVNYLRSGNVHLNRNAKFGTNGELALEFVELIKTMNHSSSYKCISPKDFKNAVNQHIPDFCDYKQQDAHEFLVRFLDRIHADMNTKENDDLTQLSIDPSIKDPNFYDKLSNSTAAKRFWSFHCSRNSSIISDLFDGLILGILRCLHCDYTSKSLEAFTCLSLPVQEGLSRTSIQISLKNFLKKEQIEAEWQCPDCRQKRNAEKSTIIWQLPKYLIIHLKRFSYEGLWRQKITTFVDFPIDNFTLDVLNGSTTTYNLYGVVNHTGSLEGGHYIAYSRSPGSFDWHRFDDSDVTAVNASDVVTSNAYVLFYERL